MPVTKAEMHGWPRIRWEQGEFEGERRIMCYWADQLALLLELDADPFWPAAYYVAGAADAVIHSAQVFPMGKSTSSIGDAYAQYEFAIVHVRYSTRGPKWDAINGLFIQETLEPAFHSFSVDPTNLRWASDNKQVLPNDAPTDHDVLYEYQVKFSNLTSLPAWILSRPGLCNSGVFITARLGITFDPQALKYCGCAVQGTYSLAKLPRYSLTAKFLHKWSGWNKFWRPDGGGAWEAMKTKDGADYIQHPPVVMNLI